MKAETSDSIETKNPRIMIYPSSRVLKSEEIQVISERINYFLSDWTTHGEPLSASFRIERNRFLIIFIDEENAKAGGCSVEFAYEYDKGYQHGIWVGFFEQNESFLYRKWRN